MREFLLADREDAAPVAPPPAPPLPSRSPPNASQLLAELAQAAPHTELALEDEPPQDRESVIVERSEEHTSELQSLMRISYAVFCLKKKKQTKQQENDDTTINTRMTETESFNRSRT